MFWYCYETQKMQISVAATLSASVRRQTLTQPANIFTPCSPFLRKHKFDSNPLHKWDWLQITRNLPRTHSLEIDRLPQPLCRQEIFKLSRLFPGNFERVGEQLKCLRFHFQQISISNSMWVFTCRFISEIVTSARFNSMNICC